MMPISYLVLAHHKPNQFGRMLKKLSAPGVSFFVHVDLRSPLDAFKAATHEVQDVAFLEPRSICTWGGFQLVEVQNQLIKLALERKPGARLVLISGQDYPLRSNAGIRSFFEARPKTDFIDVKEIRKTDTGFFRDHYERIIFYRFDLSAEKGGFLNLPPLNSSYFWKGYELSHNVKAVFRTATATRMFFSGRWLPTWRLLFTPRKIPFGMTQYGGQQWFALTASTARQMLEFVDRNPEIDAFYRFCQVPDEHYYQTILMHLKSGGADLKIEPAITYTDWNRPEGPRPVVFGTADFEILQSQAFSFLFARKFDSDADQNILDQLDRFHEGGPTV